MGTGASGAARAAPLARFGGPIGEVSLKGFPVPTPLFVVRAAEG